MKMRVQILDTVAIPSHNIGNSTTISILAQFLKYINRREDSQNDTNIKLLDQPQINPYLACLFCIYL